MIQIALFYVLPFILIFNFFGKLGDRYKQKSGTHIFLAIIIFFISYFIIQSLIALLFIDENTNLSNQVLPMFVINLITSFISYFIIYFFYDLTEKQMINFNNKSNDEKKLND